MNRLCFAVSLVALLCALSASAQPNGVDEQVPPQDADSDFAADIQYLEPVQVRAWGKELTLRVSVSRWGALDRQTEFTVDLLSTPAFVIDASFDDGAQLSFEPEKMDADLTLTLTLGEESDSAAGELTLRVTSMDAELQPQQRLLVIPFEFLGYGDARVELCLRQSGEEHPPPNCPAEGNYYRDDQVWIRYAPSVDMSEPFEWQVVAQGGRVVRRGVHDPDLGMPAYDRPTTVYEKPLNDLKDIREAGRVAIPLRLNRAGRYEVQLRAAIAKIPDLLFGSVPVAGYEFDGDWRPEGDFEVTDAKLSFKAFVTQPRVTSPGGGGAGIVLQSIKTSFGEPELHLTLPAEWERPDCNRPPERDQPQAMLRQSITSQIDLSFPAEMDILVPYDPDAGSSGSMPSMGSFSDALNRGSDAIRDRINPGTWYSVAGTLGLAGTGQVPVGRCDELYAVQTSLRFGDMHVTNQSLAGYSGSLSGGGLNILYNNSTPTPGLERIDTQKGHDYVRGNAGGFDLQMRPIILGGEFGSPQRTLGDHIRNGDTRFIIPVAMQLSMWGKPGPAQRHLGKPLMGFAVYGLTEKPYDGGSPPGAGDAIAFADSAAAQIPADSNSSMARGGDALADALVAAGSSGTGGTGAQAGGATTSGVKPQVFIDDFRSAPRSVAPATTPVTAPASAVETTDIADAQAQREVREREQDEAARRERADAIASRSDGWSDRIQSVDDNSAAQDARDAAQQATAAQAAANAPPVVFTDDANDFDATMDDLRDEQEQLEDEAEAILTGNTPGSGSANAGSMTDDEVIGTVLTGGDTTDFDTRSVDCNEQTVAGGNKPASISINVDRAGSAQFTFQTYGAEDHMWVVSGGQTVFDSTCIGTNGNRTATVQLSPFGETKVVVKPNCLDDNNTAWNFTMSCPQ